MGIKSICRVSFVTLLILCLTLFLIPSMNLSVVSAAYIPTAPVITCPTEPTWNTVTTAVTTTEELQQVIDTAGATPTKIILTHNVSRIANDGAVGQSVLKVAANQKVYLTSSNGSTFKINAAFSGDTTRGVMYVAEGGTLYLGNVVLTGGNRTIEAGGGGGVLLGLGASGGGTATLIMESGSKITENTSGFGGGVYISQGSQLYMLGGSIDNNSSNYKGGGVYSYPGGSFFMKNGEISDNTSNSGGDGVYSDGNATTQSTFTMTEGKITNATKTSNSSGGVILSHAVFNMTDGIINNQSGSGTAGGVGVVDSTFNMWGGQISNNKNYYGGAVTVIGSQGETTYSAANCSTFNMYGGIIGGSSKSEGNTGSYPGVMIGDAGWNHQGGTFNMYGGKIAYNYNSGDYKNGGGLYVTNHGVANVLGDSEISNNQLTGSGCGGGIGSFYGTLTVGGNAKINNNSSQNGGGGIYASASIVNLNNNYQISKNSASQVGGGLCISSSSTLNLNDGKIADNTAGTSGGGLYISSSSTLNLNGGKITDNRASDNGGGLYAASYSTLHLQENSTVSFSGNTASKLAVATTLPSAGAWSGNIASTSIDGMQFTGVTKNKINDYIASGGTLNKLIVFNNYDINMISTNYFYVVNFESNEGSAVSSQLVTDDGTGTANQPNDPTKTGYTFDGWYTDKGCTNAYDFNTSVKSDMTLYAKWSANKYNVTYDSQGGSSVSSEAIDYNSTAAKPSDPTRTGYTFGGWYKNKAFTDAWSFNTYKVTNDITLYAKWHANKYNVTYNSQGGSSVSSETIGYNSIATKPSDPTYKGHKFLGWYTDKNCKYAWNFSNDTVTGDITLYAKWDGTTMPTSTSNNPDTNDNSILPLYIALCGTSIALLIVLVVIRRKMEI